MGLCVEPDPRLTGRNLKWSQKVAVIPSEAGEELDARRYRGAALLTHLGMTMADADGDIDEAETRLVAEHLQDQLDLTPHETQRLDAFQALLMDGGLSSHPPDKKLIASLPIAQRRKLGELLVSVAVADGVVTSAEQKQLKRLYGLLDLDPAEAAAQVKAFGQAADAPAGSKASAGPVQMRQAQPSRPGEALPDREPTDEPTKPVFRIDRARLQAVREDTRAVAAVLSEALALEAEAKAEDSGIEQIAEPVDSAIASGPDSASTIDPPAAQVASGEPRFAGMSERFAPFAEALAQQTEWSAVDLRELADRHGVMASAAVEAINEWSQEHIGDWLIDDTDPGRLVLELDLLPAPTTATTTIPPSHKAPA
ncbi:MAG: tellurite resistance TerB C-terminal domain-containing protein [Planctomycetota bacterium]